MRIRNSALVSLKNEIFAQILPRKCVTSGFRSAAKIPVDPVDGEDAVLDGGDVVVLKEEDAVGVLDDGTSVAGEEVLHRVPVRGVDLLGVALRNPASKCQDSCHPCWIIVIHVG